MKKITALLVVILFFQVAKSQDIIIQKNGNEISAQILEVNSSTIKYKKFDNINGPTYTILKTDVLMIKYVNGTKDVFDSNNTPSQTSDASAVSPPFNKNVKSDKLRRVTTSVYFIRGIGMNHADIDLNNIGEVVSISGGGGIGFNASIGYNFSKSFGVSADIGWQRSVLNYPSYGIYGDFSRWLFLITPKLLLPIDNKHQFNLGGGLGLYADGWIFLYERYYDLPSIFYSPAWGGHLTGEYRYNINGWLSIGLGAKYSVVTYNANYVAHDYITVADLKNEARNFNGDGFDFFTGVSISF